MDFKFSIGDKVFFSKGRAQHCCSGRHENELKIHEGIVEERICRETFAPHISILNLVSHISEIEETYLVRCANAVGFYVEAQHLHRKPEDIIPGILQPLNIGQ